MALLKPPEFRVGQLYETKKGMAAIICLGSAEKVFLLLCFPMLGFKMHKLKAKSRTKNFQPGDVSVNHLVFTVSVPETPNHYCAFFHLLTGLLYLFYIQTYAFLRLLRVVSCRGGD